MIEKPRLFITVNCGGKNFMRDLFSEIKQFQHDSKLVPTDIVLFEGGSDINSNIYGETPGFYTQNFNDGRDSFELFAWKAAQKARAKMFGICRGAQLFCALSGGKVIQHVSGHLGDHFIDTCDGEKYQTSSVHHQMMAPMEANHKLLAWSTHNRSKVYLDGNNNDCKDRLDKDLGLEPEAIWFPDTKCLGVQGHPEFMPNGHKFQGYCRKIVQQYLLTE